MKGPLKKQRGGARQGAGAKPMYGEKTVNVTFRVPESHRSYIRRMVYDYLDNLKTQNPKTQIPEYGC